MKKTIIWIFIRILVVYIFSTPLLLTLWFSDSPIVLVTTDIEVLLFLTSIIAVIGYSLLKVSKAPEVGQLLLASVIGIVILILLKGESYRLNGIRLHSWTFLRASLYFIMLLYFVFPVFYLKRFLFLVPMFSLAWLIFWITYAPLSLIHEFYNNIEHVSDEKYKIAVKAFPDIYLASLKAGGLSAVPLMLVYAAVRFGNNPRQTYISLKKRFAKTSS